MEQPDEHRPTGEVRAEVPELPIIAGIGASAGGVEALQRFFAALPEQPGVAFVVILHLSPDHESRLSEVLQRTTAMPVRPVTARLPIEPDHVYVVSPSQKLRVADGHLETEAITEALERQASIDFFFRTLADAHGDGIGVILSGSGSDGAVGLREIKRTGGLVLVQDPADALHDGMPRSAIATGVADFVLPVEALARRLAAYCRDRRRIVVPDRPEVLPAGDTEALKRILDHLYAQSGHDFSRYKRSTVLRRIGRRMQACQIESLPDYLAHVRAEPEEVQHLLKSLLISVTSFFRDPEAWAQLQQTVIPRLFEGKRPGEEQVRVWVAGCATGEEAYTVAILLLEHATTLAHAPGIQVFATDLDEAALAYAREGRYPAAIAADLSEDRLRRFFMRAGDHYRVNRDVRDCVLFATHSLLQDPPFSRQDLITCRNLLIYLERDVQASVCETFHYALRRGGHLFLGSAESAEAGEGISLFFQAVDKRHRIYARREVAQSLPRLTAAPGGSGHRVTTVLRPPAPVPEPPQAPAEVHRHLLESFAPPSVVVDRNFDLVHLSESAGRYLRRPAGPPTKDLLKEARPELRLELQAALLQAFEHNRATSSRPVPVRFEGDAGIVYLFVRPASAPQDARPLALVLFAEVQTTDVGETAAPGPPADGLVIRQLEAELQRARERQHALVEEYESSQEEMKAANEELQSMNEEYKSTLEELETGKEELQLLNEELESVNQELKISVEELSQANSDLQNLMAATEIGMLFLDRDLLIRRYTPPVAEVFNIMPTDRGRRITDLTHRIEYDGLMQDAVRALHELVSVEREVRNKDGRWFLVHVRPYVLQVEERIDGVAITFIDITQRKRAEEDRERLLGELHREQARLRAVMEQMPAGLIIVEAPSGRLLLSNPQLEELMCRPTAPVESIEDYRQWPAFQLDGRAIDVHAFPLARSLEWGEVVRDEEIEFLRGDGTRCVCSVSATPIWDEEGRIVAAVMVLLTITERKRVERALKDLNETLEERVRERTEQVRRFASALTLAEQRERRRIAEVLHDHLQQILYGAQMRLQALHQDLAGEGPVDAQASLREMGRLLKEAIHATRTLSIDLSPPLIRGEGLEAALHWLGAQMEELHGLKVDLHLPTSVPFQSDDLRVLLFQIVRELLFNVVKHAGTRKAVVEMYPEEDHLCLTVSDLGRGFVPEQVFQHSGLGLIGIHERLELFGGHLSIHSTPGAGTRATVTFPMKALEAGGAVA